MEDAGLRGLRDTHRQGVKRLGLSDHVLGLQYVQQVLEVSPTFRLGDSRALLDDRLAPIFANFVREDREQLKMIAQTRHRHARTSLE